jgi:hypothetical protein
MTGLVDAAHIIGDTVRYGRIGQTWRRLQGRHCVRCERCTWNPGPDCGKAEHPHCETCGHCDGRHS